MSVRAHGGVSMSNSRSFDSYLSKETTSRTTSERTVAHSSVAHSSTRATISRPTGSYNSSYRTIPGTRGTRSLPNGPGPLPNRHSLNHDSNDVRFVAASEPHTTRKREETQRNSSLYGGSTKSSYREPLSTCVKTDFSSPYSSSNSRSISKGYNTTTSGSTTSRLSGRRSQSFSNLNLSSVSNSHTSTRPYRPEDYADSTSRATGLKSRTKTIESLPRASEHSSFYMSTIPRDYKSPPHDSFSRYRKSSFDASSPESSPSSDSTSSNRKSKFILDYNDNKRDPITASPKSLSRNSSSSLSPTLTPISRDSSDGLVGLRNLGNTCFMNSILQCLSSTWLLTNIVLKGTYVSSINNKSSMKGRLVQAFADLIKSMWKHNATESAISAHAFKTQIQRFAPRFVGFNQQDAQEFLHFLLEGLHDDLNKVQEKPKYKMCEFDNSLSDLEKAKKAWKLYIERDNSLITDLFVGVLKSTLICLECGFKSVTFDPFWDLSLPIPRKSGSRYSSSRYTGGGDVDIRDCMELFTKEEVLDGDERPTCEKCKKKRKSTKKFTVQRFPRILVIRILDYLI